MRQASAPQPHGNNVVNHLDRHMGPPEGSGAAVQSSRHALVRTSQTVPPVISCSPQDVMTAPRGAPSGHCATTTRIRARRTRFYSPAIPRHHHRPVNNLLSHSGNIIDVLRRRI